MHRSMRWSVLVALALVSSAAWAEWRAEVVPDGVRLVDPSTSPPRELGRLSLGPVRDLAVRGEVLYVAPAAGGLVVVSVADPRRPSILGKFAEGHAFSRLFISGDSLLGVETRHELRAFALSDPSKPVATELTQPGLPPVAVSQAPVTTPEQSPAPQAKPPSEASASAKAHVVDLSQGRAIIDAGTSSGITEGSRIKILSQQKVSKPDLATGRVKQVPSNETTAVVLVEQADESRAMVRLGRGDLARVGDVAVLAQEPLSERLYVPRRAPFTYRFGYHARPFIGLGSSVKSVGLLFDLHASYYTQEYPLRLEVAVAPGGFSVGSLDHHYPFTGAVTAAYATDYFEIGLGFGGLIGEPGPCYAMELDGPTLCEENNGPTINQVLRLGALDGLNLVWQSSIFSRPQQFVFGGARAELNVPLTSRLGLFGAGGAGENGWSFGEFGVRTYLNGTGASGTMIVSASLGFVGLFDGRVREMVAGPSIALGMEWRQ